MSHTRKIIDNAVLVKIKRMFTPTRAQFGFQTGILVHQEIITADYIARRRGMRHLEVLDLEKAYDCVDRRKLLHIATKWLPTQILNMVRCLLRPLTVRSKGDPTNLTIVMTRGVPQGAPSSPVLFNMCINELGDEIRANEGTESDSGAAIMVADDVLLQATSRAKRQSLLVWATWWQGRSDASWSTEKSTYLSPEADSDTSEVYLSGQRLKAAQANRYLGILLTPSGMNSDMTPARLAEGDAAAKILAQCNWWAMEIPVEQVQSIINM